MRFELWVEAMTKALEISGCVFDVILFLEREEEGEDRVHVKISATSRTPARGLRDEATSL